MIKEEYVSFEVARLLKDKGFDQKCSKYCMPGLGLYTHTYGEVIPKGANIVEIPTQAMAMRWLREVHNLCIEPYRTAYGYLYTISTIPYGSCKCNPKEGGDDEDSGQWTTYEDTCEAAIKYCLENLI